MISNKLGRNVRPGAASLALLLILAITAGWWALALWPAGAIQPEWLVRTRAACFGSQPGGLPDLSGWILLIGQPLGMVGVLWVVWSDALRRDLAAARSQTIWRRAGITIFLASVGGMILLGSRVLPVTGFGQVTSSTPIGTPRPISIDGNDLILVDQSGVRQSLAASAGKAALVTFAFGHCTTVCPTIVYDLKRARQAAGHDDVPLIVVTLDPWRDTPERLTSLVQKWGLGPHDKVLSGQVQEVQDALDALSVTRSRDLTTGDIDHVATVLAMNQDGILVLRLDGGWDGVQVLLRTWPKSLGKAGST
jgi:cytochrome oxidase Cu insertion factor (SCO1/SenC/PrrC family)